MNWWLLALLCLLGYYADNLDRVRKWGLIGCFLANDEDEEWWQQQQLLKNKEE